MEIIVPIGIVILAVAGLFFYFLPSIVAFKRKHPQQSAIIILNIFLGWTFIGWVIALVWANTENK